MNGLPALSVLPVPLSRMVAPYATAALLWPGQTDTETFIPDTNPIDEPH
jgi:hypothetical protein